MAFCEQQTRCYMRIEQRGETSVLLCSCCNLPFAKLQFGRLVIQSKHHGDDHTNALNVEELESILELIRNDTAIIHTVPHR
jgi:hypothetical protein